jgi:hypothetical protein
MLGRAFVGYSLLDGHDVRFANVAEPFPIAYICEIYVELVFYFCYDLD